MTIGDPRDAHRATWLPDRLNTATFGSIEGKKIVVTGTNSKPTNFHQ